MSWFGLILGFSGMGVIVGGASLLGDWAGMIALGLCMCAFANAILNAEGRKREDVS